MQDGGMYIVGLGKHESLISFAGTHVRKYVQDTSVCKSISVLILT